VNMGALQSSTSFPWFRFKLTLSIDEVEAEEAVETAVANTAAANHDSRQGPKEQERARYQWDLSLKALKGKTHTSFLLPYRSM